MKRTLCTLVAIMLLLSLTSCIEDDDENCKNSTSKSASDSSSATLTPYEYIEPRDPLHNGFLENQK